MGVGETRNATHVQRMEYTLSRLEAKHVENANIVLVYREVHSQSVLQSISSRESRTTRSRKGVDITLTSTSPLHVPPQQQRAGALMLPSSCLDGRVTPVGPGLNPQYTGALTGGCGLLANQLRQAHCAHAHTRNHNIFSKERPEMLMLGADFVVRRMVVVIYFWSALFSLSSTLESFLSLCTSWHRIEASGSGVLALAWLVAQSQYCW